MSVLPALPSLVPPAWPDQAALLEARAARLERIRWEQVRAHACAGKERFGSYHDAARAAKAMRRRKGGRRRITAYKCPWCRLDGAQAWHVGRRPPRKLREARAG